MKKYFVNSMILLMSLMWITIAGLGQSEASGMLYPGKINTQEGPYYGYLDASGDWIVPPGYDYASPFSEGYGVLGKDDLYGVVNAKGKQVVPWIYESISPYHEKRAVVVTKEGMSVIDTTGKKITQKDYPYIQDYSEGLAVIGEEVEGKSLYGYISQEGEEVIPPQYQSAQSFNQGKALVNKEEGIYQLIDQKGQVKATFNHPYVYGYNEGLLIYKDKLTGKYGYLDEQGKSVIPPQYEHAEVFKEGTAVVSQSPYFSGKQGLIDKKGKEIYPPIYNDIKNLGEGRIALGQALDKNEPLRGSIYALADNKGNILTDFLFYGIDNYQEGRSSVFDADYTYWINLKGKPIQSFQKIPGSGTITPLGKVIRGEIDYETLYFNEKGKLIYEPNRTIELANGKKVLIEKVKPHLNTVIYYPKVNDLANSKVQSQINETLKTQAVSEAVTTDNPLDYTYYSQFTPTFYQKNLLQIDTQSSTYYFGAAHPLPGRRIDHIDLQTGTFYTLEDLFKPQSPWKETLSNLLAQQAKIAPIKDQLYTNQEQIVIEQDQGFYVDEEALYIYYSPYDIGPYAAGYITFKVPYSAIKEVLNQEGAFWKSYHS